MEAVSERTEDVNTGEVSAEDKATEQTSDHGKSTTPRRGLRQRGVGRPRPGVSAPATDVNGASLSPQSSGRVLRDRSTRTVPAWLKEAKSEDENEEELDTDAAALKRRKVSNGKRKKQPDGGQEAGAGITGDILQTTESHDQKSLTDAEALPSKKLSTQSRAKPTSGRATRGPAKPVCKTEPSAESPVVDEETNKKFEIKKKEEGDDLSEDVLDVEPQFQDLTNISAEEEEDESSEEDVPFRDDLNDQSYDPKGEKEGPKPKRRLPPRQREKREKETDKHPKAEKEIKKEGTDLESLESAEEEVKAEEKHVEETGGPRKRGRRKKDDKTPRLPKRRKKPPVQYVRCEMEGCGTVLAHPRYLQHHIKYQHLLKKKYVCPHPSCGRLFRLQKQLLRHAKHHTDQRDYICEYCARAFKSSHNLAVHRMIHTGEKPLQCEICGFTCRQKASLNWHMKKHDADATYQFSCSICGKKFEKKDCVVAHKAKSHPEVLIAEALAANAGALITTPASLLELQGIPVPTELGSLEVGQIVPESQAPAVTQVEHMTQPVGHQVVLLGQDQSLHTMQVPVTIALSPIDPPSPADQTHLQLQMPVQFVQGPQQLAPSPSTVVTQQPPLQPYSSQQQSTGQPHILQMTFQPVSQLHLQTSSPALVSSAQSQAPASSNGESFVLDNQVMSSTTPNSSCLQQTEAREDSVVWEQQETSSDVKQGWCTRTENRS
ncbi:E3 ubiquitin-protein ligase ZFP91 isoform X2 [Boleophthalmus pectinirostris]|uniref:E3 ubiquitin-protein ligase ZFP91 isoform X2 n=1 Tax=Boleophthalmus pectinirostris TaxID=150288 RepID=UPI000A1C226B|nr:E3 ubiquitin-protein ligase ZFP91 isoform X2 [Boleophthalmus pectinirostris]